MEQTSEDEIHVISRRGGGGGGGSLRASPKLAAEKITAHFLEAGNFFAAGGSMGIPQAIAARSGNLAELDEPGFAGLAVESVGYTVSAGRELSSEHLDIDHEDSAGVHIYVARGSRKFLSSLPTEIAGVPCTVHNVGKLSIKPEQSGVATHRGNLYERRNRIACGSSCAPSGKQYSGTFGALVKKKGNAAIFALSNNHVFGDCNHVPIGQPIMAPSGPDSGPHLRAPVQICSHSEITELRSGAPALVNPCREDLAIAEVPDPDVVSSWQGEQKGGYDTPTAVTSCVTGLRVKKWGRTTGLTFGTMQSLQVTTSIPYEGQHFRALVWFRGIWSIRSKEGGAFGLPGDSGSLVVTEDGKHAVGILFAVSAKGAIGLVIPMSQVSQSFGGINLVGNHGV